MVSPLIDCFFVKSRWFSQKLAGKTKIVGAYHDAPATYPVRPTLRAIRESPLRQQGNA